MRQEVQTIRKDARHIYWGKLKELLPFFQIYRGERDWEIRQIITAKFPPELMYNNWLHYLPDRLRHY